MNAGKFAEEKRRFALLLELKEMACESHDMIADERQQALFVTHYDLLLECVWNQLFHIEELLIPLRTKLRLAASYPMN